MMKIDRRLAVATLILTVLSVIAGFLALTQTSYPAVAWTLDSVSDLVRVDENARTQGDLEIRFNGQQAENVEVINLTFVNAGNMPFKGEDFISPLSLTLNETAQIFQAQITQKTPASLEVSFTAQPNSLAFSLPLFNPQESFSVQIVGSDLGSVSPGGRIVGISTIPLSYPSYEQMITTTRILAVVTGFCLGSVTVGIIATIYGALWIRRRVRGIAGRTSEPSILSPDAKPPQAAPISDGS